MIIKDTDIVLFQEKADKSLSYLERIALAIEENNRLTRMIYVAIEENNRLTRMIYDFIYGPQIQEMPDKGWLKAVLEEARKDVNTRPEWQKNRVRNPRSTKQTETCKFFMKY